MYIYIAFFTFCYFLAFGVEFLRFRFRPGKGIPAELCLLGAGITAHTALLAVRIFDSGRSPLSCPQDALFVLAWVLTGISMGMISTYRRKNFGLFLLPAVLITLGIAFFADSETPFALRPASAAWGMVHGFSMLLAAVSIFCGFLSGIMYLRQAWNLKHPGLRRFRNSAFLRLPSLEWLHYANRHSMKLAASMLALGVLSGIVLDVMHGDRTHLLRNWMILGTMSLLAWFVISLVMGFIWKRANAGPQIAYRTILSFAALCVLFGLVIFSQHRVLPVLPSIPSEPPVLSEPSVPSGSSEVPEAAENTALPEAAADFVKPEVQR